MRAWVKRCVRGLTLLIGPFLGWLFITLLTRTLRITQVNAEVLKRCQGEGKAIIAAMWHGEQFLVYRLQRRMKVAVMSSLSADGEIQSGILRRFGYEVVRGSSSRGGARALVEMLRKIREGYAAFFAVDGPRGPLHDVKPGVIYLAEKTGGAIIPVSARAERYTTLTKSWDKYMLPHPFSRAVIIYGNPLDVTGDIERGRQALGEALAALSEQARDYFARQA